MTTGAGVGFANVSMNQAPYDVIIIILIALPCTGGSHWQKIDRFLPGGVARLKKALGCIRPTAGNLGGVYSLVCGE